MKLIGNRTPEQNGDANRHVGIPAEITVDLDAEAIPGQEIIGRTQPRAGALIYGPYRRGQRVREYQLLEKTDGEDRKAKHEANAERAPRGLWMIELGQQIVWAQDGSCDQVRKKQDKPVSNSGRVSRG